MNNIKTNFTDNKLNTYNRVRYICYIIPFIIFAPMIIYFYFIKDYILLQISGTLLPSTLALVIALKPLEYIKDLKKLRKKLDVIYILIDNINRSNTHKILNEILEIEVLFSKILHLKYIENIPTKTLILPAFGISYVFLSYKYKWCIDIGTWIKTNGVIIVYIYFLNLLHSNISFSSEYLKSNKRDGINNFLQYFKDCVNEYINREI